MLEFPTTIFATRSGFLQALKIIVCLWEDNVATCSVAVDLLNVLAPTAILPAFRPLILQIYHLLQKHRRHLLHHHLVSIVTMLRLII